MSEILLQVAFGKTPLFLNAQMANRHGLIAGATGTGKTVSLQVLAEAFSSEGIPVFMSDVKGDLSGIGKPGIMNKVIAARTEEFGLKNFNFQSYPVCFYDVFGQEGHPLRTTIAEMGALLLSRLLNLNDTQSGALHIVFRVAQDVGKLLIDLNDLREMLQYVGENAKEYIKTYGNVTSASLGAIQRGLFMLEEQGGNIFFGKPNFDIFDLIRTQSGKGVVNILSADKLMQSPALYSTMLMWLLSDLYIKLPEVGDLPKPKLIFFFDEAHLLFNDSPKVLRDKIEKIVRLIRSKGVGVYFVTQSPSDIPDNILGQLGNRIQHALRAFTPRDQQAVRIAAQTFRSNPSLNTERVITELGKGEALVSFLELSGSPSIVERAKILPPHSQIGPLTNDERAALIKKSTIYGKYEQIYECEPVPVEPQKQPKRGFFDFLFGSKKDKSQHSSIDETNFENDFQPSNTHVDEEYFNTVKQAVENLVEFYENLKRDTAFIDTISPFYGTAANSNVDIKDKIQVSVECDIARCYVELGHSINFRSKEGLGIYLYELRTRGNLDKKLIQFVVLNTLMKDEMIQSFEGFSSTIESSSESMIRNLEKESEIFIVSWLLGFYDKDLQKKYLVLLYRFSSIIAKADDVITEKEEQWLSKLLNFEKSQKNDDSSHKKKQEDENQKTFQPLSKNPQNELNELIGLASVKSGVETLINFIKIQQAREEKGLKSSQLSYHCIFTGNPGTGKTTVARIVAEIYKELGVLKTGHLVETDRSGLVGEYVGHTAVKTNKIIDSALDGVLFIDEAYSLITGDNNDYGKEAVATLLKRMEDNRDRLIVILAGYTNEMEDFLNSNPGLKSRFNRYIEFPDYSADELYQIFDLNLKKFDYKLSYNVDKILKEYFRQSVASKDRNFGNARFVRNFFEKTIENQANRLSKEKNLTTEKLSEICNEDINIDSKSKELVNKLQTAQKYASEDGYFGEIDFDKAFITDPKIVKEIQKIREEWDKESEQEENEKELIVIDKYTVDKQPTKGKTTKFDCLHQLYEEMEFDKSYTFKEIYQGFETMLAKNGLTSTKSSIESSIRHSIVNFTSRHHYVVKTPYDKGFFYYPDPNDSKNIQKFSFDIKDNPTIYWGDSKEGRKEIKLSELLKNKTV